VKQRNQGINETWTGRVTIKKKEGRRHLPKETTNEEAD